MLFFSSKYINEMEVVRMATDRKENKFRLGLSFSKYLLLLLNVVFAVSFNYNTVDVNWY